MLKNSIAVVAAAKGVNINVKIKEFFDTLEKVNPGYSAQIVSASSAINDEMIVTTIVYNMVRANIVRVSSTR